LNTSWNEKLSYLREKLLDDKKPVFKILETVTSVFLDQSCFKKLRHEKRLDAIHSLTRPSHEKLSIGRQRAIVYHKKLLDSHIRSLERQEFLERREFGETGLGL
jgi:hypothetical protein